MKKAMIVFAAAFMFASCGNGSNGTQVTTDTTGVKCDTCHVDTTVVVADPVPANPPADVEPGTVTPTIGNGTEPKPHPLPKTK